MEWCCGLLVIPRLLVDCYNRIMKIAQDGYNWIVRLDKDEKLIEQLTKIVTDNNIPSCWVSAIGAVQSVELGYYKLEEGRYIWKQVDELMEIASLQGNIAFDNQKPIFHLHGSFSKDDCSVVGGHVKDLTVAGTCEIFLHKWYNGALARKHDNQTGLNLLNL